MNKHFLEKLEIINYKSIKNTEIDFKPVNILIGANGVGKSNLLSLFELLNNIYNKNLTGFVSKNGGSEKFLHFGRKVSENIFIKTEFHSNQYKLTLHPAENDSFKISDRMCYKWDNFWESEIHDVEYQEYEHWINVSNYLNESRLKEEAIPAKNKYAKYIEEALNSWKKFHFHDTSKSARIKQSCNIIDKKELKYDGGNLAAFLYNLKQNYPEYYIEIVETIKLIAPYFNDFVLEPDANGNLLLLWKEQGNDLLFNANQLSDGTIRFMCFAALLLQPNLPSLIIIDEPELGLHPYALSVLANLIYKASDRKAANHTRLLVATQSVTLINNFTIDDVIIVDKKDGQSTFERKDEKDFEQWLEEYSVGDLWEKNLIGGRP